MVERLPGATGSLNEIPHTRGRIPSHESLASKAPRPTKHHRLLLLPFAGFWNSIRLCW